MPSFTVVNAISDIPEWPDAKKFNSLNRFVDESGKELPSDYTGTCYQLIAKKQLPTSPPAVAGVAICYTPRRDLFLTQAECQRFAIAREKKLLVTEEHGTVEKVKSQVMSGAVASASVEIIYSDTQLKMLCRLALSKLFMLRVENKHLNVTLEYFIKQYLETKVLNKPGNNFTVLEYACLWRAINEFSIAAGKSILCQPTIVGRLNSTERQALEFIFKSCLPISSYTLSRIIESSREEWEPILDWMVQRGDLGDAVLVSCRSITPNLLIEIEQGKNKAILVEHTCNSPHDGVYYWPKRDTEAGLLDGYNTKLKRCLIGDYPISDWKRILLVDPVSHEHRIQIHYLMKRCLFWAAHFRKMDGIIKGEAKVFPQLFSLAARKDNERHVNFVQKKMNTMTRHTISYQRCIYLRAEQLAKKLTNIGHERIDFFELQMILQEIVELKTACNKLVDYWNSQPVPKGCPDKQWKKMLQGVVPAAQFYVFNESLPAVIEYFTGVVNKLRPAQEPLWNELLAEEVECSRPKRPSVSGLTQWEKETEDYIKGSKRPEQAVSDFSPVPKIKERKGKGETDAVQSERNLVFAPVPSLADLPAQKELAGIWSVYFFDLPSKLLESHARRIEMLPQNLQEVATHAISEIGTHVSQATLSMELLAESLREENAEKMALALQTAYLHIGVALEQKFSFAYIEQRQSIPIDHNITYLKSDLRSISPAMSRLGDKYRLALFWVRFLNSRWSREVRGSRLNDLAGLWGLHNHVDLKQMVRETVSDYCEMVNGIFEEESPLKYADVEKLQQYVDVLLSQCAPRFPTTELKHRVLREMSQKLLKILPPDRTDTNGAMYDALKDAIHLIRLLDLGLQTSEYERRPITTFWRDEIICNVDKIAEQIYATLGYVNRLGRIPANHNLYVYQNVLQLTDRLDSQALLKTHLGIRTHYPQLPRPRRDIAKAYTESLLFSEQAAINFAIKIEGCSIRERMLDSIPHLKSLVDTCVAAISQPEVMATTQAEHNRRSRKR